MLRKDTHEKIQAIDTVMTTMGQIASIEDALRSLDDRTAVDVNAAVEESTGTVSEWIDEADDADINSELLHGLADIMSKDIEHLAAEKIARDALTLLITERLRPIKARQKIAAKALTNQVLNVTPHMNNIVQRHWWDDIEDRPGFEPILKGETFLFRPYSRFDDYVRPFRDLPTAPYKNYIGYSLKGVYAGRGKAKNYEHMVSLVDVSGAPIVTITPKG